MKSATPFYVSVIFFGVLFNFVNNDKNVELKKELEVHKSIVYQYYLQRKDWITSTLGSILYKNVNPRSLPRYYILEKYLIFVQPGNQEEERILFNNTTDDFLEGCSVDNCLYSDDYNYLQNADAVVINVHKGFKYIPKLQERNPNQIWILYNEESLHTYASTHVGQRLNVTSLSHLFNWTMTYRSDCDVPIPYGRTIPRPAPFDVNMSDPEVALRQMVPYWNKKQFNVLATIIMSNCIKGRMKLLAKLRKIIKIHVEGQCFSKERNLRCQNFFSKYLQPDCKYTSEYIFYLAFEDSNCRQYLTEKIFHHAYSKGAIPIIKGPPIEDCAKLLPPNSFLHIDSYKTLGDLVKHMHLIVSSRTILLSFHAWRKHFAVTNEHGYFKTKSTHLCRVCEALNYNNDGQNIYEKNDIRFYIDETLLCYKSYEIEYPEI